MANGRIHIGQFRDRIIIQSSERSTNANTGQIELTWINYGGSTDGSRAAKKEAIGGAEGESGGIVTQSQRLNFIIRYDSTIDLAADFYRIKYNDKFLDLIQAEEVLQASSREFMRLRCEWKSNQVSE